MAAGGDGGESDSVLSSEPDETAEGVSSGEDPHQTQRQFRDTAGHLWCAFERPLPVSEWTSADQDSDRAGYGVGWLWFECGERRRRLRLYIKEWHLLSDEALRGDCARAREEIVPSH